MRVVWTLAALSHLEEIQDYIALESPEAAYRVAKRISERLDGLAENPNSGRNGRVGTTRELIFPDLPYIAVYRVKEQVEIVAIIHAARDWPEQFE